MLRQLELPVDDGDGNSSLRNNMRTLLEHDTGIYVSALRLASRLRSVYALTMHSQILERLEQLGLTTLSVTGGVAVHVMSDELRIPGGYMRWRPHQGWAAGQGSLKLVTIWAPLMDIPSDFYPLKLIPASHLMGVWKGDRDKRVTRGGLIEIDSEQYRGAEWLSLNLARGDVAFLTGLTVHTTGSGIRSGVRIACGVRYEDIAEPSYVERGYPCAFGANTATQEELHPGFPQLSDIEKASRDPG